MSRSPDDITLKDVLRAIFMPPEEVQGFSLPSVSNISMPELWQRTSEEGEQPDVLNEDPAHIRYPDEVSLPDQTLTPRRLATATLGTLTAVFVIYLAQLSLKGTGSGLFLLLIAGAVWLGILIFEYGLPDTRLLKRGPVVDGNPAHPFTTGILASELTIRLLLGGIGLAGSVLTYLLTAGNIFRPMSLLTWTVSVMTWLLSASKQPPIEVVRGWWDSVSGLTSHRGKLITWFKPRLLPATAFVLIMAAAVFFRFHRLDATPYQMTSDHVEKLLDSYDVSQGIYHVFFTRNGGREAIQFYLVPLAARVFGTGLSFLTLKIVSVLEGLALIPLMMLLGREVIDRETGFYAAALLAVSWWHVALSRLALRIVLTPLLFTLVLVTLIRGIRSAQRRPWLWAGIWLGVSVYGYQAMRMAPLVAVAAFLAAILGPSVRAIMASITNAPDAPRKQTLALTLLGRQALNLAAAGLVSLAIFVPMLRVWHDFPEQLWNRVINRTTETERNIEGTPTEVFADNYRDALRMYNVRGDAAWVSAVPGEPVLSMAAGALFLLGVMAWGVRLALRKDPVDAFLLLAMLIMLLPSALAIAFPIENPSTTRASGTIPIVFLIAAWPLALIRQKWAASLGHLRGSVLAGVVIGLLLVGSAVYNYEAYFTRHDKAYRDAALNPSQVADAVRDVIGPDASLDGVWLQGWPHWHDYRAIGIEAGDITFSNAIIDVNVLVDYLTNYPDLFSARPLVFIVHPADEMAIATLREWFPYGELRFNEDPVRDRDFYLYIVAE